MNKEERYQLINMDLCPTGQGWNVRVYRVRKKPRMYYQVSKATLKRFQRLLDHDEYHNYFVTLGRTGWVEFDFYPDKTLK